jgi:hypothetical protein
LKRVLLCKIYHHVPQEGGKKSERREGRRVRERREGKRVRERREGRRVSERREGRRVRERGGTESERRGKECGKQGRKLTKINAGGSRRWYGFWLERGGGFKWYGFR